MKISKTHIEDLFIIEPKVFNDSRGYFFESYNNKVFENENININFVQDNEAKSTFGVLRGLHFQNPPYTQTKLIRVINGKILDVVIDLRKSSKTYGSVFSIELNDENKFQLLVPKGFAHGYVVLSDEVTISYKVDGFYKPDYEDGIVWNDKNLDIDWKVSDESIFLSEKDKNLKSFINFNTPFK